MHSVSFRTRKNQFLQGFRSWRGVAAQPQKFQTGINLSGCGDFKLRTLLSQRSPHNFWQIKLPPSPLIVSVHPLKSIRNVFRSSRIPSTPSVWLQPYAASSHRHVSHLLKHFTQTFLIIKLSLCFQIHHFCYSPIYCLFWRFIQGCNGEVLTREVWGQYERFFTPAMEIHSMSLAKSALIIWQPAMYSTAI